MSKNKNKLLQTMASSQIFAKVSAVIFRSLFNLSSFYLFWHHSTFIRIHLKIMEGGTGKCDTETPSKKERTYGHVEFQDYAQAHEPQCQQLFQHLTYNPTITKIVSCLKSYCRYRYGHSLAFISCL